MDGRWGQVEEWSSILIEISVNKSELKRRNVTLVVVLGCALIVG